ncbi:MAG: TIGR02147 family protein [Planctomycetales bacterium]
MVVSHWLPIHNWGMKSIQNQTESAREPVSFRSFLQSELAARCARNRRYSLRAFARQLEVDHATLSQILRGKRPLTRRAIETFAGHLNLDRASIERFLSHAGQPDDLEQQVALREIRQLAQETAQAISEWYHFAILELIHVREFRPDTRWIARSLGISTDEVCLALQRLLRLGLLEMASPTRWIDRCGDVAITPEQFTRAALQRLMEKSHWQRLAAVSPTVGAAAHLASTTVAMSAARVPAVVDALTRCQAEILSIIDRDESADDVYRLELCFFPVTTLHPIQAKNHE